jgi:hypothetical protein
VRCPLAVDTERQEAELDVHPFVGHGDDVSVRNGLPYLDPGVGLYNWVGLYKNFKQPGGYVR